MKRLFVTGDTHQGIDIAKLNSRHFKPDNMTKEDIVVIMGDAGFVWDGSETDKYWQDFLDKKPWTTFCVLGNHEAYPLIEKLPIVDFHGGKAYKVNDSLYYAVTGEVYDFIGKKCLVVNGADSTDKIYRTEGKSWWKQERITPADTAKAMESLNKVDGVVDFVFSHTGGSEVVKTLGFDITPSDRELDRVLNMATYEEHFCGHYHIDELIGDTRILYDDVIMIAADYEDA